MVLRIGQFFYLYAFVDASFGIHSDMKSGTGVVYAASKLVKRRTLGKMAEA